MWVRERTFNLSILSSELNKPCIYIDPAQSTSIIQISQEVRDINPTLKTNIDLSGHDLKKRHSETLKSEKMDATFTFRIEGLRSLVGRKGTDDIFVIDT